MNYELDDDRERLDLDVVWTYLSTDAYWNRWPRREDMELQFQNAWRVIGAYVAQSDELIGFARAVSDGVSDAYLGDVYVAPTHRGRGDGGRMVSDGRRGTRGALQMAPLNPRRPPTLLPLRIWPTGRTVNGTAGSIRQNRRRFVIPPVLVGRSHKVAEDRRRLVTMADVKV